MCHRSNVVVVIVLPNNTQIALVFQEKTKVKALSEELENPMNVHRWRKLEGSDPTTFEMIQKIHTLQKRLISKTEEVRENAKTIRSVRKERPASLLAIQHITSPGDGTLN